jgi:hypothetical protein
LSQRCKIPFALSKEEKSGVEGLGDMGTSSEEEEGGFKSGMCLTRMCDSVDEINHDK